MPQFVSRQFLFKWVPSFGPHSPAAVHIVGFTDGLCVSKNYTCGIIYRVSVRKQDSRQSLVAQTGVASVTPTRDARATRCCEHLQAQAVQRVDSAETSRTLLVPG